MAESFLGIHLLGKGKGTQFFVLDSIDQPKIEFGGKEFRQKLSGKKACYYDWLRDSNEQIFGLKFIPYWNFLIDWKIRSSLSSVEDDLYAIYFGEQREYIPGISADQTDFGSKLFGDGRTYILTFGLANSTLEAKEVEQINRLVLSQK